MLDDLMLDVDADDGVIPIVAAAALDEYSPEPSESEQAFGPDFDGGAAEPSLEDDLEKLLAEAGLLLPKVPATPEHDHVGGDVTPEVALGGDVTPSVSLGGDVTPEAVAEPPVALPADPRAEPADFEEVLKSGSWGVFRLTVRKPSGGRAGLCGAYSARCIFHRKNDKSGCAREFKIEGPDWVHRYECIRRALWWLSSYDRFDRWRDHFDFDAIPGVDGELPTAADLHALKVVERPCPGTILTDAELDELFGVPAAPAVPPPPPVLAAPAAAPHADDALAAAALPEDGADAGDVAALTAVAAGPKALRYPYS
jgi:hypothetical protein